MKTDNAFTHQLLEWHREAGTRHQVEPDIHEKDFIYWFLVGNDPSHAASQKSQIDYYFADGEKSAKKLAKLVQALELTQGRRLRLLEFASGYGCVTRHLKKEPIFDVTSCDIHPEAIEFLSRRIAVKTIQSTSSPDRFALPEKYDVVFALSFFSHMPRATWGAWVKALCNALEAPGYLIFTTHGWTSAAHMQMKELPPDGFWFAPLTEQKDIDPNEYGCTIVTPEFAFAEIRNQTGSSRISFMQSDWWNLQDVWVVKRDN